MNDLKNTSAFKAPGTVDVAGEYEVRRRLALALESERIMNADVPDDEPKGFDTYLSLAKGKVKDKKNKKSKKGKK